MLKFEQDDTEQARRLFGKGIDAVANDMSVAGRGARSRIQTSLALRFPDDEMAEAALLESSRIKEELGDRIGLAISLGGLAAHYIKIGAFDRADSCLRKGLDLNREIGNRFGEAMFNDYMGLVFFERMKLAEDEDVKKQYAEIAQKRFNEAIGFGIPDLSLESLFHLMDLFVIGSNDEAFDFVVAQATHFLKANERLASEDERFRGAIRSFAKDFEALVATIGASGRTSVQALSACLHTIIR